MATWNYFNGPEPMLDCVIATAVLSAAYNWWSYPWASNAGGQALIFLNSILYIK